MRLKSSSPAELIVGSSQDIEDDLSDVEEVFIRKGGKSREIENKPLMPSRKKHQHKNSKTTQQLKILKKQYRRSRCHRCLEPFCYAFLILLVILILSAIVLTLFPVQKLKLMFQNASPKLYQALLVNNNNNDVDMLNTKDLIKEKVPCQNFAVNTVWSKTFAKLNSEAPVRKTDLNGDGIDDIIFAFGVDDMSTMMSFDGNNDLIPQCKLPNGNGQVDLCGGGIVAINGINGEVFWKYWTAYAIFSLFCKFDANGDAINDCIISGPGGLLHAIDGKQGKLLWELKRFSAQSTDEYDANSVDLYTINLLRDLDSDLIPDIIAAHTDERFGIREGHICLISGKTGKIIRTIQSPFKEEIFVPIQLMTMKDGSEYLLVLTGGQNTAGGVYKIRLDSFKNFHDDNDYTTIQRSSSGFLVPAILTDLNGDLVEDFVVSSFNSTVYAFNGVNNNVLWIFTFPSSETVSSIVPGFFNKDNVLDFMIKYNTGPGFPIYFYSQTTILDGTTGKSFFDSKITDSGGPHSLLGGISIQTSEGDFFLHFQSHCRDKFENAKDSYKFVPDSDIIQQSRADVCKLRYNTSTVLKLNAISRHMEPPGAIIFSSDNIVLTLNQSDKSSTTLNNIRQRQPLKHPKMRIKLPPNRYQQPPIEINKKQSNMNEQLLRHQQQQLTAKHEGMLQKENLSNLSPVIVENGQKQKAIKFRENQLNQDLTAHRFKLKQKGVNVVKGFEDAENSNSFNDIMNKISLMDLPREYKEEMLDVNGNFPQNEAPEKSNDYDMYYDQSQQRFMPSRRNWNANNRGIRSESDYETPSTYETILHDLEKTSKKQDPNSQTVKKVLDDSDVKKISQPMLEPRPETLWDIEIEKENRENHKNGNRRRRDQSTIVNENILPAVSSTGVLVESLNKTNDTIDFVFILNVRESEAFPPLLTPADVQCVEDKMAALGNYPSDILDWQKGFLKECLKNRLYDQQPDITVQKSAYETQITIVRLSITCTCNDLNSSKEECSTFNNIQYQKWPEYMGVQLDGSYNN